ncbi:FkbM family methyltransferase [Nostoc sp.]|uniref:FkbM family methyltransferase n=1 Tax=Nostoc sp. TaxID=1180 RepID=UPI0035942B38
MTLVNYLKRPEYILRPTQIYHRILRSNETDINEFKDVLLPWGVKIKIRPYEVIGRSIWTMGLYDLVVTEALWRLIDRGETAIDIGANIGYMTSIMAKKVGKTGSVYCYEPQPEIYKELSENINSWQASMGWYQIKAQKIALSNESGEGLLETPTDFIQNRGIATLISSKEGFSGQINVNSSQTHIVSLSTLDETLRTNEQIDVIKIDVEGHEFEVLQGAARIITKQHIRDILFEEHRSYPSSVTQFLEERGYTIFRLCKGFWRPMLKLPMTSQIDYSQSWEPPNYLATKEPSRAIKRMQKRGWNSLRVNNN